MDKIEEKNMKNIKIYMKKKQNILQKYSTVNKPTTTVNINVKSYGKDSNMSSNINNNIKKAPSTGYIKTEVTKTTYTKEESKPYVTKNIVTKYETKGANNVIKNNNVTVVSSNYQSQNAKDNNKSSNVNVYQSKYINTDGNNKEKKTESKNVTTKIELLQLLIKQLILIINY